MANRTVADYSAAIDGYNKSPQAQPYFANAYGYAVFPSVGKGGLMYEAAIEGQKFSFKPLK